VSQVFNGVSASALSGVTWVKSRYSGPQGNCVEFAPLPASQGVAIRNSRHPGGPALIYTTAEIEAMVRGARDGDFDHLF
jgi:hypothetical protein